MDTWWIDKPCLLGSSNLTDDADLERLRQGGFAVLVSLLKEDEQPPGYDVGHAADAGFTRHSIPVKDFYPPTVDQLEQFVGLIATLPPGTRTIVHCEGGTGRTGTFAAAYWVAKGLTVSEAVARVRKARPGAVETPGQEAVLREFASRHRAPSVPAAERPRLVVHTVASVDGRVSLGVGRTGFDDAGDERWQAIWASDTSLEESARALVSRHRPQVLLEGSGSFVAEGSSLPDLPSAGLDPAELYRDFLPGEVVRAPDHRGWFAVVDGRGRVRAGMKEFPGWEGWRTLHLVSYDTPPEYLAFLRRREIPYLIAGCERVDLAQIMAKLRSVLGVTCVVCTAGSRLNGALLRAGLVDEVSLVLLPALIGGSETPQLFRGAELGPSDAPTHLELLSVEGESQGRVCLRYRVVGTSREA